MWRVYPRLGGATNQPFVWLRYGGLWSDAEIIVYYYRAKALSGEWEIENENGEFERIRPHLTPLECGIIFDGIPEGAISRKVGLIWGIPA